MEPDPLPSLIVTLIFIFFAFVLVFFNAFFVAAEFSLVKVRRTRLEELAAAGNAKAKRALNCVIHLDEYLSVCQLGITLVSLGLGWIGEKSFYSLLVIAFPHPPFSTHIYHLFATGISFFIISMLHVVLGELVPKSMAIQKSERIAIFIAGPLQIFYKISKPLINVFTVIANFCLKSFGFYNTKEAPMSEEELKIVVQASTTGGIISDSEAQIIHRAFTFADKKASDIMIPLEKVQYLSLAKSFAENKAIVLSRNYTRFPVCRTDMSDVIGIANMKDLRFQHAEDNSIFEKAVRPPMYFQANEPQDKLLKNFRERRFHLALVQDPETKKNIGVVTMEDILEDLVGDIVDEHGN